MNWQGKDTGKKLILKMKCLFYQNIYVIFLIILFYIFGAIRLKQIKKKV